MRFSTPGSFPALPDFLKLVLNSVVIESEDQFDSEITPTEYLRACVKAAEQSALDVGEEISETHVALCQPSSRLAQIGHIMAESMVEIRNVPESKHETMTKDILSDVFGDADSIKRFITTFCDDYSGSLKKWLAGNSKKFQKPYNAALFFTYLLLEQPARYPRLPELLKKLLALNGITEVEETVWYAMMLPFRYTETSATNERAIKTLSLVMYLCFDVVGKDVEVRTEQGTKLYNWINERYSGEVVAFHAAIEAEKSWLRDIQYYAPRSITLRRSDVKPQDFYVQPSFLKQGTAGNPMNDIVSAEKSVRAVVMAKTGMGKTMYLRMLSMCLLKEYLTSDVQNDELDKLADAFNAPLDKYVIFVPAGMFSFCYNDSRYSDWTTDFVSLYFNSIFKLAGGYNFYSANNPQRSTTRYSSNQNLEFSPEIRAYMQECARQGRLVLLLDSFDEIVSGGMRDAYIKAVNRFCDNYCNYPEYGDVGAHIIITSRQMSPSTMDNLASAIMRDASDCVYSVQDLTIDQRNQLIYNWGKYYNEERYEIEKRIRSFDENHFCQEFSTNPYMISVLCDSRGAAYDNVTQEFINTLIKKTRTNYRVKNDVVNDVLQSSTLVMILQDIALITIRDACEHFSGRTLEREISSKIHDEELTQDMIDNALRQLHEILISAVGLIVPADGEDSSYQFINGRIRYHLAAKAMQRAFANDKNRNWSYQVILAGQGNTKDYIGMLIPLLCDLKDNTDPDLAESLVIDLALRNTNDEDEQLILEGIVDLLLGRYGSNLTTPKVVGDQGGHTIRAQRILMLRLLSAPSFSPSDAERIALRRCSAFGNSCCWLRAEQIEFLNY